MDPETIIRTKDELSELLYEASVETHKNRPGLVAQRHESFSGFRGMPGANFPDFINQTFNLGSDGVGTKIEVAERLEDHSKVAFDLFAMVCDDAVVGGAEAVGLSSVLELNQLDGSRKTSKGLHELAMGYVAAAEAAKVVIVNGESAPQEGRIIGYGPLNYTWSATVMTVAHNTRMFSGHELRADDVLVGFTEPGFRSNGLSDVRRILSEHAGDNWHEQVVKDLGDVSLGRLVQTPSTIYCPLVNELTGGYDIKNKPKAHVSGVAHITGGGQPAKIGRMLKPSGLGIEIDDPIEPPRMMLKVQELAGWDDSKAYHTWHMGPGMVVATSEPEIVIAEAELHGVKAKAIGRITEESGIRIKNAGAVQDEEYLVF
jgi:phosphoribosylformylglycinamidine cyclo-ligase